MTWFLRCDTRPKIRSGPPAVHRHGDLRFNGHRQRSSTAIGQDRQMPNTALALLDTVTEPAIAVER
jgi:hypothetical protein